MVPKSKFVLSESSSWPKFLLSCFSFGARSLTLVFYLLAIFDSFSQVKFFFQAEFSVEGIE